MIEIRPCRLGFWDALAAHGWRRDDRMLRYIKTTD